MKQNRFLRHMFAILAITVTLHATAEKCDCKSTSSSSGTTPPPNPTVSVQNSYGVSIVYEIWTGTNLEYKEGTVLGDSLSRSVSLKTLTNGSTDSSVATVSYDGSFIIVVGVVDGTQNVYLTNLVVKNLQNSRTIRITSSGAIN